MTLLAETNDFKKVQFTASEHIFSQNEKIKRGLKSFFIFFIIALLCILIPILHFVLVPGFFIFAIYKFVSTTREMGNISNADFKCPSCNQQIQLKNISLQFPRKEHCPGCRNSLKITVEPLHN